MMSRTLIFSAAAVLLLSTLSRAGDPSAHDLKVLAPVLDTSMENCRSIDIAGTFGSGKDPEVRLKFRATYQPNGQSFFYIVDAVDNTPLVLCAGKRMVIYDPVQPAFFYSENSMFSVELSCINDGFNFNCKYMLNESTESRVFLDFKSLILGEGAPPAGHFTDSSTKTSNGLFVLTRIIDGNYKLNFSIDPKNDNPYKTMLLMHENKSVLDINIISVNKITNKNYKLLFDKNSLNKILPIKDVTFDKDFENAINGADRIAQASLIRSAIRLSREQDISKLPGMQLNLERLKDIDWDRVKQNDKKYSKILKDLIPAELRSW